MDEQYSIHPLPTGGYYVCKGEFCWQNETFETLQQAVDFVVRNVSFDTLKDAHGWAHELGKEG